ncbi:MAG: hypothetical protein AAB354_08125 [candidate division KSB1 bacterium]
MNVLRQALQEYSARSRAGVPSSFVVAGAVVGLITFLYVYFIARHHQQNFLLSYLLPLALLAFGLVFFLIGVRSKGGWEGLIYVVLALFALFAAAIGFVVTWLLLAFVY